MLEVLFLGLSIGLGIWDFGLTLIEAESLNDDDDVFIYPVWKNRARMRDAHQW